MISFVYVIGSTEGYPGSLVKIGVTTDLRKRLQTFQSGSPVRLAVLWAVPGDQSVELWLHREFSVERRHGEWFELGPDPVKMIQEKLGPYMVNVVLSQVGEFPISADTENPEEVPEDGEDLEEGSCDLLTAAEAAVVASQVRGVPVSPSTIRTWKHRGHLPASTEDGTLFDRNAVVTTAMQK